jgi:hypothetical protein
MPELGQTSQRPTLENEATVKRPGPRMAKHQNRTKQKTEHIDSDDPQAAQKRCHYPQDRKLPSFIIERMGET